jgi:hypothetical protein
VEDVTQPNEVGTLAAMVSRQSLDLNTYAGFLLNALDGALPKDVVVVQRKTSLFGRSKPDAPILCVTVRLGEQKFVLQRSDPAAAPTASIGHEVGGITLRTEATTLDGWSLRLAHALAELASRNADTAAALQRLTAFEV